MNSGPRSRWVATLPGLVIVVAGAAAGWKLWWAPQSVETGPPTVSDGSAPVASHASDNVPQMEEARYPADTPDTPESVAETPATGTAAPPELQAEPDYEAQIRMQDMPPALLQLMQAAFVEFYRGNIEYAAMLSLEALEASDDYPAAKPMLYAIVGNSYEKLGYIDMALEHYRAALAIYPSHRASYGGMRRLDPEFAASHPKLPAKSAGKTADKAAGTSKDTNYGQ